MLKAAVIGAGFIGLEHLACLRALPSATPAAVCDLSAVGARCAAERFGVEAWYTDARRMLADVRPDVVHVTTPAASHLTLAMDALEAGAHVLVEKPITPTPQDLEALLGVASRRGRIVVENHNYLYNDGAQRVLAMYDAGRLGQVVHVEVGLCLDVLGPGSRFADPHAPHPAVHEPAGIASDFLTHLAYLATALIGEPRGASANWTRRSAACHGPFDEMRALVEGEVAPAALLFSARGQPDAFWLRVHGTQGRVETRLWEPHVSVERCYAGVRPLTPLRNGLAAARAGVAGGARSLRRKLAGGPGPLAGLWALVAQLYEAIDRGEAPPVSPDEIRRTARLVSLLQPTETPLCAS